MLTAFARKNGYFGLFCTEPGRALPDSTGTVTLSRSRMGAGVSNVLLQILQGLLSDHKQCRVVNISPSEYQKATALHMIYVANFRLNKWQEPQPGIQRALLVTGRMRASHRTMHLFINRAPQEWWVNRSASVWSIEGHLAISLHRFLAEIVRPP